MKATDRTILLGIAVIGLVAAFWFLALAPKRERAAELRTQVEQLEASVAEQEQMVADATIAKDDYEDNYRRLVVLGKAVPSDEDTSSLFVQLDELAGDAEVGFDSIELAAGGSTATAPPDPAETTADGSDPAAVAPVTATEASAAALPLGATVGTAGLPVMPYTITLNGSFFELADFLHGIDSLVEDHGGRPHVQGRLLTIDGFELGPGATGGFSELNATLNVTTYVTPADQGATGGATPTEPAESVAPTPSPTSSTTAVPTQ